ncbi:hypothetical protein STEG23_036829 [Scotinomys teguina]
MARKAGQGKEEEESRARQQEEKTPVREEEEKPACHGGAHHVVKQGDLSVSESISQHLKSIKIKHPTVEANTNATLYNSNGASQRRVTFHLPDGSQESCSDSGLGDHEPVGSGTLISHPLPLVQPQDEFYDQASPDKRTEADGNSDPNSVTGRRLFDDNR